MNGSAVKASIASLLLTAALLAAAPALAQPAAPANPIHDLAERRRALAERMEAATFWIVVATEDGVMTGSGFLVGEGLILTNGHVVGANGPREILVLNDSTPATEARLIAIDYDQTEDESVGGRDFALLAFDNPAGPRSPLSFNLEARKMDLVGAWGFPQAVMQFDRNFRDIMSGREGDVKAPSVVFTEGSISALVEAELGTVIMHSASVSSGNSGGPLVNQAGEVVGINTQRYARREDLAVLNIALGAADIVSFLVDCGVTPSLSEGQTLSAALDNRSRPGRREAPAKRRPDKREDDGETRFLTSFKVKVPPGWGVMFEEEDSIALGTRDFETNIWIAVADSGGLTLKEVASFYAALLNGSQPRLEEDVYVFEGTDEDGVETVVAVSELDENRHVFLSLTGDVDDPGVDYILESLEDR